MKGSQIGCAPLVVFGPAPVATVETNSQVYLMEKSVYYLRASLDACSPFVRASVERDVGAVEGSWDAIAGDQDSAGRVGTELLRQLIEEWLQEDASGVVPLGEVHGGDLLPALTGVGRLKDWEGRSIRVTPCEGCKQSGLALLAVLIEQDSTGVACRLVLPCRGRGEDGHIVEDRAGRSGECRHAQSESPKDEGLGEHDVKL